MAHLDITIDLETLSLSPTAAILQIAAVAWDRDPLKDSPFLNYPHFDQKVDVRSCIMDGFEIDASTVEWWSKQDRIVQENVLMGEAHPLYETLNSFLSWIGDVKKEMGADSLCLWAQGSDFDIAILRNAFEHYGSFPFRRTEFRDARTFILEMGHDLFFRYTPYDKVSVKDIYKEIEPMPTDDKQVHNAIYDARNSSWNVWRLMCCLNEKLEKAENVE